MPQVITTYHKDCIDGTAAAAVVLRKYPQAQLFPLAHAHTQEDIDAIVALIDEYTLCFTVDAAFGVREFLARGCAVTTIDHHIGVKDELEALALEQKNFSFVFDNDKSGSSLAWSYFFPGEPLPSLIAYVEDADLWKLQLGEDTKHVNNYLSIFRNDPAKMLELFSVDINDVIAKGRVLSQYVDREIQMQLVTPSIMIKIGEDLVPAYNNSVYESAIGNAHASEQGKTCATFIIRGDKVKLSFRSLDGQSPSSLDLATVLGGGGHKNAAGATIPRGDFLAMIQDNG